MKSTNKKILLIGGGGHCKSVLDTLYRTSVYDDIGIVDIAQPYTTKVLNTEIVGEDKDLPILYERGYRYAFVTIGSIGNPVVRIRLYKYLLKLGFQIPNIIDPSAVISDYIKLGNGNFIGKNVVVNADTVIGNGTIINTAATIEHDCKIGSFSHLAPKAVLCGSVSLGENVHIGTNTAVIQNVNIVDNVIVGAGSIVVRSILEEGKYYGIPAQKR